MNILYLRGDHPHHYNPTMEEDSKNPIINNFGDEICRCPWAKDPFEIAYHDLEWGIPVEDDLKWHEYIILDSAQAGVSWRIILHKREGYREVFHGFDPEKVAKMSLEEINLALLNPKIIRNKLKVNSAVTNAQAFLKIKEEFGTFNDYIWRFTEGKSQQNKFENIWDVPSSSPESDRMSKDLKKRGFKFVGSTICYALMQAAGMVNDHLISCHRYHPVKEIRKK